MDDLERCDREIADIEALLRSGHPDTQGLCLALADWAAERGILQRESAEENRGDALKGAQGGKENPDRR